MIISQMDIAKLIENLVKLTLLKLFDWHGLKWNQLICGLLCYLLMSDVSMFLLKSTDKV